MKLKAARMLLPCLFLLASCAEIKAPVGAGLRQNLGNEAMLYLAGNWHLDAVDSMSSPQELQKPGFWMRPRVALLTPGRHIIRVSWVAEGRSSEGIGGGITLATRSNYTCGPADLSADFLPGGEYHLEIDRMVNGNCIMYIRKGRVCEDRQHS